jgi:chromosome segregation ATPase
MMTELTTLINNILTLATAIGLLATAYYGYRQLQKQDAEVGHIEASVNTSAAETVTATAIALLEPYREEVTRFVEQIRALESKIATMESDRLRLEAKIALLEVEKNRLVDALAKTDQKLQIAHAQIEETSRALAIANAQIEETGRALAIANDDIRRSRAREDLMADRLAALEAENEALRAAIAEK